MADFPGHPTGAGRGDGRETMTPIAALNDNARVGAGPEPGPGAVVADPAAVEWTWSPWRERPGRAAVALGFTLLVFALVVTLVGSAVLAVLMMLAVAGTLAPLLVPSRCRVDHAGIALRSAFGWESRAWSDLRRARPGRDAIVMSPFTRPRRLDVFRAVVLPLPAQGRDALLAAVRMHCERHEL